MLSAEPGQAFVLRLRSIVPTHTFSTALRPRRRPGRWPFPAGRPRGIPQQSTLSSLRIRLLLLSILFLLLYSRLHLPKL